MSYIYVNLKENCFKKTLKAIRVEEVLQMVWNELKQTQQSRSDKLSANFIAKLNRKVEEVNECIRR